MNDNITKYIAIIIVIGVLAGIAVALYLFNKPAIRVVSGEADFTVDANTLFAEFEGDEERANEKYLNKVVAVKGKVAEISDTDGLGYTITLETEGMFGVSCEVTEQDGQNNIKKGDNVTMKGLCSGKLMDVVLVKCMVSKK